MAARGGATSAVVTATRAGVSVRSGHQSAGVGHPRGAIGAGRVGESQGDGCVVATAAHLVLLHWQTGTGKTLAFLIPSIERLARSSVPAGAISILVLSPTRELASQIEEEAISLCRFHKLSTMCIVGGHQR